MILCSFKTFKGSSITNYKIAHFFTFKKFFYKNIFSFSKFSIKYFFYCHETFLFIITNINPFSCS